MKRFNIEISEEEQQFCADFRENIEEVLSFDKDCETIANYIKDKGLPADFSRRTIHGKTYGPTDLREAVINRFIALEKYETCAALANSKRGGEMPESLLKLADHIMSFDDNCEVCYLVLYRHETSPWYGFKEPPTDSVRLMIILLNYFHDKGMHDRCAKLKPVFGEIKHEVKDGNPLFKTDIEYEIHWRKK